MLLYRGTNDQDVWTDIQTITGVAGFPEQSVWPQNSIQAVKAANPGANIVLTGHSPGGSLHPARKAAAPGRSRWRLRENSWPQPAGGRCHGNRKAL
ncbi:MAG: hypothetical protein R3D02_05955 [Hyphomicrobiales bacterium]